MLATVALSHGKGHTRVVVVVVVVVVDGAVASADAEESTMQPCSVPQ